MDGPSAADALRRSLEQGRGGWIGARRPIVHRLLSYTHLLLPRNNLSCTLGFHFVITPSHHTLLPTQSRIPRNQTELTNSAIRTPVVTTTLSHQ